MIKRQENILKNNGRFDAVHFCLPFLPSSDNLSAYGKLPEGSAEEAKTVAIRHIEYDEALRAYMAKKGMSTIVVEVVSSQHSDFEVTELHVHLVRDGQAEEFKKKKYRAVAGELGEVLLPPYVLEYDETLSFSLGSFWIFRWIKHTGIRL